MLNRDSGIISNRNLLSPVGSSFTTIHEDAISPVPMIPVTTPVLGPPQPTTVQQQHQHQQIQRLPPNAAVSPTENKSLVLNSKPLPLVSTISGPLPPLYPLNSPTNGVVLHSLQLPHHHQQQQQQQQQSQSHQHLHQHQHQYQHQHQHQHQLLLQQQQQQMSVHQVTQAQQTQVAYVNTRKPQESPPTYPAAVPDSYRYVAYQSRPLQRHSCPTHDTRSQKPPPAQPWFALPVTAYGKQYVEPQYYHLSSTPSYVYHTSQYIYNQQSAIGQPRKQTKQTTWTPEEDKLLQQLKGVQKLGWREISAFFYDRTPNACQFRWRRIISGIASSKSHSSKSIAGRGLNQISKKSHHSINFLLN